MFFFISIFLRPLLCARCGKQMHECVCEDVFGSRARNSAFCAR